MKSKSNNTKRIVNRRARHDYELGDSFVMGVQLSGKETKALRMGHGQLRGAYITVKDGELWLINATINSTNTFQIPESEQTRTRKLLAKRKEIDKLIAAKQQGMTIVPTEFMTSSRYIKLRASLGRGKKRYDKRQTIKKREQGIEADRAIKKSSG